ncbi:MAG: methyltransferase domain-containing protein [Caldithrix sp.]|nr:methyltransferase domain-containing protein [Caldithrix sp.]
MNEASLKNTNDKLQPGRLNFLSNPENHKTFEEIYRGLRQTEGRHYDDQTVAQLPDVPHGHPFFEEWRMRKDSMKRLYNYLRRKRRSLTILDLGCGNGWLAHRLAHLPHSTVYALDKNQAELEQSVRLFSEQENLMAIYGDIFAEIFDDTRFDSIILASVVQYFKDTQSLIGRLIRLLKPEGELHILDSPIYSEHSAPAARQRSYDYFERIGYPVMMHYYFHHRWEALSDFDYTIKYNPNAWQSRFQRKFMNRMLSPFPWIVIYS